MIGDGTTTPCKANAVLFMIFKHVLFPAKLRVYLHNLEQNYTNDIKFTQRYK